MTPQLPSFLAALTAREVFACPTFWGLLFGAIGLWFLIPGGLPRFKMLGGVFAAVGLICLFADLGWLGTYSQQAVFVLLAGITLIAAVGTISSQSPVYCAVWFAVSLLGTAGIFLVQGAQFLGVATVVVYAGAIVVTFLFVLMLAQPQGHDVYDRISWGAGPTALGIIAAATLVGLLTHSLSDLKAAPQPLPSVAAAALESSASAQGDATDDSDASAHRSAPTSHRSPKHSVHQRQHMAGLGQELFTRQLISVEVAGTLLLVALVGAVGMVIQGKLIRQEQEA
jgi:NADH-quinone oxidoreductase subunit J